MLAPVIKSWSLKGAKYFTLGPVLRRGGREMLQKTGVAELCTHILKVKAKFVSNCFKI